MTQLMQQRPWAVWCMFLAGAFTGGVASSLLQPQMVWAVPADLNGQKFEELALKVAEHDDILDVFSLGESGLEISDRVSIRCDSYESGLPSLTVCNMGAPAIKVTGDAGTDPLMIIMPDLHMGPVLRVEGPSLFTGDPGPGTPLVAIDPATIEPVTAFAVTGASLFTGDPGLEKPLVAIDPVTIEPVTSFRVSGHSLFTGDAGPDAPLVGIDPVTIHPGKPELQLLGAGLSVEGAAGLTVIGFDHIELLVRVGSALESAAAFGYDELGSYLGVDDILSNVVRANEFIDTDIVIDPF